MDLMTQFLQAATPEEWFFVAAEDAYVDKALITWMIEQPQCPEAVAKLIYWSVGAGFFTRYTLETLPKKARLQEDFKLLHRIERNYQSGFYSASELGFDPKADSLSGEDLTARYEISMVGTPIPEIMFEAVAGRRLKPQDMPSDWENEIPPQVAEALRQSHRAISLEEARARLRKMFPPESDPVGELLAERHAEAERE